MKFLTSLILTKFLAISGSKLKHKLATSVTNCTLLLPVENYSQTLFFDVDVDIHDHSELKTYILQSCLSDQAIVVLNTSYVDIKVNLTRDFFKTNNNPNIIIMTKYLTPMMFHSTQWKTFVRSNWSLLYIIVTGDTKFKCNNGTMNSKDFLLLDNIMNILWHRFQIMRVGVVFPFACKEKMVIYTGKRQSTHILYDRSIRLIDATNYNDLFEAIKKSGEKLANDYPITGSIFYRYPTAIKDCENLDYYVNFNLNLTDGYCGLDGMVMHDIISHLKFNISFTTDERCSYYGYESSDGVSGTLGCIIRKDLDISFNSRFLTLYSDDPIDFLHYIKTDKLCALLRKPDIVPLWQGVFNLYSPPLWALIGVVLVAIGIIMWATAEVNKAMIGPKAMTIWWYIHDSVTTTMVGYSPMKTRTLLIIRGSCLIGSILILGVYQGHMSRVYTTMERFRQIKTLEDLYSSGITLYTSQSLRDILTKVQNPDDISQKKFFDKTHVIEGDRDRVGVVLDHKFAATVNRKSDALIEILEQHTDDNGTPLIDIMDECFFTYYLSCITRSDFPFIEELQVLTERLNEAGLPNVYYKWTQQILEIENSMSENNRVPRVFTKIRLCDQSVAFGILLIGTIVSIIVFAAEMVIGRHKYCRRIS